MRFAASTTDLATAGLAILAGTNSIRALSRADHERLSSAAGIPAVASLVSAWSAGLSLTGGNDYNLKAQHVKSTDSVLGQLVTQLPSSRQRLGWAATSLTLSVLANR